MSSGKGNYVSLSKISPNIQKAVVATEDRTFWTNIGISPKGILRAAVSYVIHGGNIAGGGSTITQQLVKNSILTQQQTLSRKVEEMFYAIQVTKVYSKKQIMAMYLNNAYFGNGVYGVQECQPQVLRQERQPMTVLKGNLGRHLAEPFLLQPDRFPLALGFQKKPDPAADG